ncbi:hypothetical protein [Parasedimentitalea huanghaiensis]|uniref:Uncharacterized protein n=1 Tax=Parasedimentitalea huanghaiensis TaxID=2682100 RepID=A0A6L6WH05_9RHOB|nr:hypothetical protein [Zongyanglinia huanghaiensis]MVO16750.1 hypothetical protein [Zongyanglinia huanghaiensis]
MKLGWLVVAALIASPLAAQDWYEPKRGTAERKALMNALRPLAEVDLGAPVEFVVHDLRVSGHRAFASVQPQRPGGRPIDIASTPGFARGEFSPDFMDGTHMQALYIKKGNTWVAVEHAIGATDVWFAGEPFCSSWGPVIAEFCY